MPQPPPPEPEFFSRHETLVRDYAQRHFTDPDVSLQEVAIFWDLSERTLRKSLQARGTSWTAILLSLRMERGAQVLASTTYKIEDVARLSGYRSASAFAKAFSKQLRATPHQYRRGQGGPARAGGPTGAFFKPAQRARGESVERQPSLSAGEKAVMACEIDEAAERLSDQRRLEMAGPGMSIEDRANAWMSPRRLRDDPEYWRQRRREFDTWTGQNDTSGDVPIAQASIDSTAWPVIRRTR